MKVSLDIKKLDNNGHEINRIKAVQDHIKLQTDFSPIQDDIQRMVKALPLIKGV